MAQGRPTKLTPELSSKICKLVAEGNYPEVAAQACGIDRSTFYRWLSQGKENASGLFRDFCDSLKKAQAEAHTKNVKTIKTASKKSWQAAAWLLERQYPELWGAFKPTKELIDQEREALLVHLKSKLSPELYAQIVAVIAELSAGEDGQPGESSNHPNE